MVNHEVNLTDENDSTDQEKVRWSQVREMEFKNDKDQRVNIRVVESGQTYLSFSEYEGSPSIVFTDKWYLINLCKAIIEGITDA